jgi:hypothetical protein
MRSMAPSPLRIEGIEVGIAKMVLKIPIDGALITPHSLLGIIPDRVDEMAVAEPSFFSNARIASFRLTNMSEIFWWK